MDQQQQRDMIDEQATRADLLREQREEWAAEQAMKPLGQRLGEFVESDQARALSIIHDVFDLAPDRLGRSNPILSRTSFIRYLYKALTRAEHADQYTINERVQP